jgi:predicted MPP superfamily phosphohydrolase
MILLTGDYITSTVRTVSTLAEPLAELKADAGVFGCLGNHDVGCGRVQVARALETHGITCLSNTGRGLTKHGETLWIAGLDSAWGGRPDLARALAGRPANSGTIVMMHEPDYADTIAHARVPLLQLSGHTHGGQCCLPGGVPVHLPIWGRKYPKGLFQVGAVQLYVNRGIGCIGVPVRFSCPPEITEITLACV